MWVIVFEAPQIPTPPQDLMPMYPLRPVSISPEAEALQAAWLQQLERALADPKTDRNELCRTLLTELYLPGFHSADLATFPLGTRLAQANLDPRAVTLEPEYYHEVDPIRYAEVKPLLWLWEMFDQSPLGENIALGVPFRRILARKIFRRVGRNFKAFPFVRFTFGYNMEVGDNVVVHRHVLLDDRGGIELGNGVSISDYANVYSHSHDLDDPKQVSTPRTVVGDGVRITYHATILAGVHLAPDSMIGAMALATRDTIPSTVHVGVPARAVRKKPGAPRAPSPEDPLADQSPPSAS
jgi:acetyltransferase-like isoleucine patch superfamily enzyme